MPDPKDKKELTTAEVAKLVKRTVVETDEGGNTVEKQVAVKTSEVLAFRDYGTHVVVVTNDGQKLTGKVA